MTKLALLMLTLAAIFTSCQDSGKVIGEGDGKVITVRVKVKNPQPELPVYFYESVTRNLLDSFQTNDEGEFEIKIKENSPNFYGLNIYNLQNETFIIGGKDVEVIAEGKQGGSFVAKGSKDNELLGKYYKLKKKLEEQSATWQEQAYANPSPDELQSLLDEQKDYMESFVDELKTLVSDMDGSVAAIEAVKYLDVDEQAEFLEELANDLVKKYPDSKLCKDFKESVFSMTNIAIGRQAPDFELTSLEGEKVKLSDLQGKYVLVDFWASWCGPCRRENPNVLKMYQKYAGKNFEILGVSTDQSESQWKRAIREDDLPWVHVLDTEFDASTKYNVSSIPFTLLLDKEGMIIAKNLRGILLEKKLSELAL